MLKAVLFDLDGTLTNTDNLHFNIWRDILTEFDIAIDRPMYDSLFSGRLNVDIIHDLLPQLSPNEGVQLSERKESLFRDYGRSQLTRLEGLTEFLTWVENQNLRRAVVTNAPPKNAWFSLEVLNLIDYFEAVVISEELDHGKPHPMPYQVGLEKVESNPLEAIAFEDSPSGICSAVNAGILTVGVASTHKPDDLLDAGATYTILDFTDPSLNIILESHFTSQGASH